MRPIVKTLMVFCILHDVHDDCKMILAGNCDLGLEARKGGNLDFFEVKAANARSVPLITGRYRAKTSVTGEFGML